MASTAPSVASRFRLPSPIALSVRRREARRQLISLHVRRGAARFSLQRFLAGRIPPLPAEYLRLLFGSLIGYSVVLLLPAWFFHFNPVYALAAFGLLFSIQTAYYKLRLAADPDYKIPSCKCGPRRNDNSEAVLKSPHSSLLGIPNGLLGILLYAAIPALAYLRLPQGALALAALAVLFSLYLGYAMLFRIRSLCANCVNIAALNLLLLGFLTWKLA